MSTSILNAPTYDPKRDKRIKWIIAGIVFVILVSIYAYYQFRDWPEERVVSKFFQALEARDYEKAYGIWMADPDWKKHPNAHPRYRFGEFYLDWGPGGEYGLIKSYKIDGSKNPRHGSGVIVTVIVNERTEKAHLWVEKSDKTLSYPPDW